MSTVSRPYFKVLGIPDLVSSAFARVVATSEASATLDDANMATEEPSEFWRSTTGLSPDKPYFYVDFDTVSNPAIEFSWTGIGLVRHNLWKETGQVRIIALSAPGSPTTTPTPFTFVAPNHTISSVNTTGTHADVDEAAGSAPDFATLITPTVPGTAWNADLRFPTPSSPPRTGPTSGGKYQAIWVYARATGAVTLQQAPELGIRVHDAFDMLPPVYKRITSTTGQWVYVQFDASLLSPSGANIAVQLSSVGAAAGATEDVEVGCVAWAQETTEITAAIDNNIGHDSGWMPVGTLVTNTTSGTIQIPRRVENRCFFYDTMEETPITSVRIYVFFREDHTLDTTTPTSALTIPITPPGFIEVGKVVIGDVWTPERPPSAESALIGIDDMSSQNRTRGGQEFGSVGPRLRTATITLPWLTKAEAMFLFEHWVRARGVLGPVLVSINPDGDVEQEPLTMYCTLESQTTNVGATLNADNNRSMTLTVKEKR